MSDPITELDIDQIHRRIPHRPPMLLIDRVEEIVPDTSAVGVKMVSVNEPLSFIYSIPSNTKFTCGNTLLSIPFTNWSGCISDTGPKWPCPTALTIASIFPTLSYIPLIAS